MLHCVQMAMFCRTMRGDTSRSSASDAACAPLFSVRSASECLTTRVGGCSCHTSDVIRHGFSCIAYILDRSHLPVLSRVPKSEALSLLLRQARRQQLGAGTTALRVSSVVHRMSYVDLHLPCRPLDSSSGQTRLAGCVHQSRVFGQAQDLLRAHQRYFDVGTTCVHRCDASTLRPVCSLAFTALNRLWVPVQWCGG